MSVFLWMGTSVSIAGSRRITFATAALTRSFAFSVAACFSCRCTQLQCSRMLAISKRYLFNPASSHAFRKVGSCRRGEQEATTTRFNLWSLISFLISCWPWSEHVYRLSVATTTLGSVAANLATSSQSMVPAIFSPQ